MTHDTYNDLDHLSTADKMNSFFPLKRSIKNFVGQLKCIKCRDFPGGPVVKTSPSNVGSVGSIPGQGAKIPTCLVAKKPKHRTEAIL